MPEERPCARPDDSRIDRQIGNLLRIGMMVSGAVILIGGVLFLKVHGDTTPDFHVFRGEPQNLKSPVAILSGALHGQDLAIIQFGLLLLIATPVARVIFSVAGFIKAKDYLYVTIAGIVLLVLFYSLIWH
ncbi:MAG: DUF1634 domain-containing protein [Terriglobales bacterium]